MGDIKERTELAFYLKSKKIGAVFHYIPLHTSPAGKRLGRFHGKDRYTTKESERLLRLPLYYQLDAVAIEYIVKEIYNFFEYR